VLEAALANCSAAAELCRSSCCSGPKDRITVGACTFLLDAPSDAGTPRTGGAAACGGYPNVNGWSDAGACFTDINVVCATSPPGATAEPPDAIDVDGACPTTANDCVDSAVDDCH